MRINLYGASYGTRVAQQYLRRYPQHTRAVILDGVVPVGRAFGATAALDAESALQDILARCARQAACRQAFGDPVGDYRRVRAALQQHAVPLRLADPATGAATQLDFGRDSLATVLRLASYAPEYAALLPLWLHDAAARSDYAPLAAQSLLFERTVMHELCRRHAQQRGVRRGRAVLSMQRGIDRARLAATYLGTAQLDGLRTVCGLWPRGPMDADLHATLVTQVPALLLSGSDDPVTPAAYGAEACAPSPRASLWCCRASVTGSSPHHAWIA